ncbi:MAG TPA: dynamin family protein [Symbiobacteriaceae bacterium]|nr:dynamin family protein [Symbiobacteriaceae bacterium]
MATATNALHDAKRKADQLAADMRLLAELIGPVDPARRMSVGARSVRPGLGLTASTNQLMAGALEVQRGLYKVLVIGDFDAGKSTTLNALLGANVLPASPNPHTSAITWLLPGERERYLAYLWGQVEPEEITREQFQSTHFNMNDFDMSTRSAVTARFDHLEHLEVEYPSPITSCGVALMDSLGLDASPEHTKEVMRVLPECDALVIVTCIKNAFGDHEALALKRFLTPSPEFEGYPISRLFLVGTHKDLYDDDVLPQAIEGLKTRFRQKVVDGPEVTALFEERLLFISARDALKARLKSKPELEQESGILELEERLKRFFVDLQAEPTLYVRNHRKLERKLQDAAAEIASWRERTNTDMAELRRRAALAEKLLQQTDGSISNLRKTLVDAADAMVRMISRRTAETLQSQDSYVDAEVRRLTEPEALPLAEVTNERLSRWEEEDQEAVLTTAYLGIEQVVDGAARFLAKQVTKAKEVETLSEAMRTAVLGRCEDAISLFSQAKAIYETGEAAPPVDQRYVREQMVELTRDFLEASHMLIGQGALAKIVSNETAGTDFIKRIINDALIADWAKVKQWLGLEQTTKSDALRQKTLRDHIRTYVMAGLKADNALIQLDPDHTRIAYNAVAERLVGHLAQLRKEVSATMKRAMADLEAGQEHVSREGALYSELEACLGDVAAKHGITLETPAATAYVH